MTDPDRVAQAQKDFAKILADFVALPASEHAGSFTVHFKGHRVRSVEWRTVDDAAHWEHEERRESA